MLRSIFCVLRGMENTCFPYVDGEGVIEDHSFRGSTITS